jgi:hypothetical protein
MPRRSRRPHDKLVAKKRTQDADAKSRGFNSKLKAPESIRKR